MKTKKKYFVSVFWGCFLGVAAFFILINSAKPHVEYDYPFYYNLETLVQASNQIVVGNVIADEGVQILDVGDGDKEYCVYRIKVNETINGNAATGDEILIRIFKLNDADDQPFEVGNDYLCFLWDTDEYPAVLLNRTQSQIRLEGDDMYMTQDMYTAFAGTVSKLRNSSEIALQAENISGNLYEDIVLRNAKQETLSRIYEITAENDNLSSKAD